MVNANATPHASPCPRNPSPCVPMCWADTLQRRACSDSDINIC